MNHRGTKRLETGRLILRPCAVADAEAMYRNWASDPEVTRFLTWPPHASVDVTRQILEQWVSESTDPRSYNWMLELRETGEPIGTCSVVRIDDSAEEVEIGYCMGRRFWGRGLMPEAVRAVRDYLFDEVGANRISAKHDVENPKSGRVMRKAGMTFEGIRRQGARNVLGIRDTACYAMLASDPRP